MVSSFVILGLILDAIGAVLIAVPDLPKARTLFRFGKLEAAREKMGLGGVSEGDTGFVELVDIHSESQPNIDINPDDVDKISFGPGQEFEIDSDTDSVYQTVKSTVTIEYSEGSEFAGLDVQKITSPPEYLFRSMNREIHRGQRLFRSFGLSLLFIGFLLQLVGAIL